MASSIQPRPLPAIGELRGEISAQLQPRWLTEAVAAVVHGERGRTKAIASTLGVREGAVYEVADINNPRPLKAAWIPAICRETGTRTLLDVLAAQLECIVISRPPAIPRTEEMNHELAQTLKRFGEFIETTGDTLADGLINCHEVAPLVATIDLLLVHLSEYRASVVLKAEQDAAA